MVKYKISEDELEIIKKDLKTLYDLTKNSRYKEVLKGLLQKCEKRIKSGK